MSYNERFMLRAVQMAERARGSVSPNPHVGAVLVRDGQVIGEGCTQPPGGSHAEIMALRQAGSARGAEMYVTLEPCCIHGRTPPCTEAIIAAGVKALYAGIEDANPRVRCSGFAALQVAGIHVERDHLQAQIERQLEAYIIRVRQQRVFVVLKTAATLDGRVAARDGSSKWITGQPARADVHRLRAASDAVLTGIGTVLADDPLLTARGVEGATQPLRVVLDRKLRMPLTSQLVRTAGEVPLLVITAQGECAHAEALRKAGAEVLTSAPQGSRDMLCFALRTMYERGVNQLMVEAGPQVASAFVRHNLVDRWVTYVAPAVLGAGQSVLSRLNIGSMSQARRFTLDDVTRLGEDVRVDLRPQ